MKRITLYIVIYIVIFSTFSILRHLSSMYGDPDLGLLNQSFYTTAFCGKIFFNTFEGGSHFCRHNSPIYFVLLLFYRLAPSLITLLILQTAAIAAGAIPVYLLARNRMGEAAGHTFAILYLLYHPLHGVNYDPFHDVSFAIAPLLFAVYFYSVKRNFGICWLFLILALMAKEDVSFTVSFFGLYLIYDGIVSARSGLLSTQQRQMNILHGALMVCTGFFYLLLSIYVIIPHFNPPYDNYNYFSERYGYFGKNIVEVIQNIVLHPFRTLRYLLVWPKVSFFLETLAPLAFLSLLDLPLFLIATPTYAIDLLSSFSAMQNSGSRYPSLLIPFIFASAIIGLSKLLERKNVDDRPLLYRKIIIYPIVFTILSTLLLNPSPLRIGWQFIPRISGHQKTVLKLLREIPPQTSLSTQVNIYQHASYRLNCYAWYCEGTEYIMLDPGNEWYDRIEPGWSSTILKLVREGKYELIRECDGVQIYKKRS
ncbi:MAG: DUF2079 domain-containing protein [Vulcanimicrobiota bacterium]